MMDGGNGGNLLREVVDFFAHSVNACKEVLVAHRRRARRGHNVCLLLAALPGVLGLGICGSLLRKAWLSAWRFQLLCDLSDFYMLYPLSSNCWRLDVPGRRKGLLSGRICHRPNMDCPHTGRRSPDCRTGCRSLATCCDASKDESCAGNEAAWVVYQEARSMTSERAVRPKHHPMNGFSSLKRSRATLAASIGSPLDQWALRSWCVIKS